MIWLILGVALWWGAHFFKRVAPGPRARLGEPGKGLVALLLVASIFLMWLGYSRYVGTIYWVADQPWQGINNLLMILAFYVFGSSAAKGEKVWLATKLRHPQLTAFGIWAVAHLLVNGDTASFILFGGLLAWAIVSARVISAAEGPWHVPARAPIKKEWVLVVITAVVFTVVALIQWWLGVNPFA